jgi:ribosomal protein L11
MESFNKKEYSGRVYETKESFVVESIIGPKSVSLEEPAGFINNKLREFDGMDVKVEITIKITQNGDKEGIV